jgi:hypothetical protein
MAEVEGFEEMLAELRERPGMWRLMATVDDEQAAWLLQDALSKASGERLKPLEAFGFERREVTAGKFSVYGRYEDPGSAL